MSQTTCPHCGRHLAGTFEEEPRKHTSKFDDDDIRARILLEIEGGNSHQDAATAAGVHPMTLSNWLRRGYAQRSRRKHGRWRMFLEAFEAAESRLRQGLVRELRDAARKTPFVALAMLERLDPSRWARREASVIQAERDRFLQFIEAEFADEPKIIGRFLRAVAGVVGPRALPAASIEVRAVTLPSGPVPPEGQGGS